MQRQHRSVYLLLANQYCKQHGGKYVIRHAMSKQYTYICTQGGRFQTDGNLRFSVSFWTAYHCRIPRRKWVKSNATSMHIVLPILRRTSLGYKDTCATEFVSYSDVYKNLERIRDANPYSTNANSATCNVHLDSVSRILATRLVSTMGILRILRHSPRQTFLLGVFENGVYLVKSTKSCLLFFACKGRKFWPNFIHKGFFTAKKASIFILSCPYK